MSTETMSRTLRDLMCGHLTAKIRCPVKHSVVRILTVIDDALEIDADTVVMSMPLDTELHHEPWLLDRGSVLFRSGDEIFKLCTVMDTIHFPDGTARYIPEPPVDIQR